MFTKLIICKFIQKNPLILMFGCVKFVHKKSAITQIRFLNIKMYKQQLCTSPKNVFNNTISASGNIFLECHVTLYTHRYVYYYTQNVVR